LGNMRWQFVVMHLAAFYAKAIHVFQEGARMDAQIIGNLFDGLLLFQVQVFKKWQKFFVWRDLALGIAIASITAILTPRIPIFEATG